MKHLITLFALLFLLCVSNAIPVNLSAWTAPNCVGSPDDHTVIESDTCHEFTMIKLKSKTEAFLSAFLDESCSTEFLSLPFFNGVCIKYDMMDKSVIISWIPVANVTKDN